MLPPPALRSAGKRTQSHAVDVHVEYLAPVLIRAAFERPHMPLDAGVQENRIQAPELLDGGCDHPLVIGRPRDINRQAGGAIAKRFRNAVHGPRLKVGENDTGALGMGQSRRCFPDAASGTGHNDDFPFKRVHGASLFASVVTVTRFHSH